MNKLTNPETSHLVPHHLIFKSLCNYTKISGTKMSFFVDKKSSKPLLIYLFNSLFENKYICRKVNTIIRKKKKDKIAIFAFEKVIKTE